MDVMLDLETFSTAPTAAIVQIGACFFDPASELTGDQFNINVNVASCMLLGMHISPATIDFWKAQKSGHLMTDAQPLQAALSAFSKWFVVKADAETKIWSHGAAFDIPILDHAFHLTSKVTPWAYRNVRDTRTLFALAQARGWVKPVINAAHEALADAMAQAIEVQAAIKFLGVHHA